MDLVLGVELRIEDAGHIGAGVFLDLPLIVTGRADFREPKSAPGLAEGIDYAPVEREPTSRGEVLVFSIRGATSPLLRNAHARGTGIEDLAVIAKIRGPTNGPKSPWSWTQDARV